MAGLLCDLMLAEPVRDTVGWGRIQRNKETFHTFGPDVLFAFLAKHDMDLVVRSNQVLTKDCNKMSVYRTNIVGLAFGNIVKLCSLSS